MLKKYKNRNRMCVTSFWSRGLLKKKPPLKVCSVRRENQGKTSCANKTAAQALNCEKNIEPLQPSHNSRSHCHRRPICVCASENTMKCTILSLMPLTLSVLIFLRSASYYALQNWLCMSGEKIGPTLKRFTRYHKGTSATVVVLNSFTSF